jgi:predicted tellurium resistance membrane protein TerC
MISSQRFNDKTVVVMISKVFTSDWFALVLVAVCAFLLSLLYIRHRTTEAVIGGILLSVAVVLIVFGRGRKPKT